MTWGGGGELSLRPSAAGDESDTVLCACGAQAMWQVAQWYTQFGLMAGTVFREVLRDAQLEGMHAEAAAIRGQSAQVPAWTCMPVIWV